MVDEVVQYLPEDDICHECHRERATRLCDFALGESIITFYRDYDLFKNQKVGLITCDNLLCDKCSNRFYGMDLCKNHYKKITGG